jgi:mono/diheme cytochrome c family protein
MSRHVHLFAAGTLVAALFGAISAPVGAAQGVTTDAAALKNPVPATAESVAAGKSLYVRRCSVCHGEDAKGGEENEHGPARPDLTAAKWDRASTEANIFRVIKNGIPPKFFMQPFGDRLSDTDLWNIVNFLHSLSAK